MATNLLGSLDILGIRIGYILHTNMSESESSDIEYGGQYVEQDQPDNVVGFYDTDGEEEAEEHKVCRTRSAPKKIPKAKASARVGHRFKARRPVIESDGELEIPELEREVTRGSTPRKKGRQPKPSLADDLSDEAHDALVSSILAKYADFD